MCGDVVVIVKPRTRSKITW